MGKNDVGGSIPPGGSKALTSGNTVSPSFVDCGGAYNGWRTLPLSTVWVHGRARPQPAGLGAVAVLAAVTATATVTADQGGRWPSWRSRMLPRCRAASDLHP